MDFWWVRVWALPGGHVAPAPSSLPREEPALGNCVLAWVHGTARLFSTTGRMKKKGGERGQGLVRESGA